MNKHDPDTASASDTRSPVSHGVAGGTEPGHAANTSGKSPRQPEACSAGDRLADVSSEGAVSAGTEVAASDSDYDHPEDCHCEECAWSEEIWEAGFSDNDDRGVLSDEEKVSLSSDFRLTEHGQASYIGHPVEEAPDPRRPALDPEAIRRVAEVLAIEQGYANLDELISSLPRGRPTREQGAHLDAVAKIVQHLRSRLPGTNSRLAMDGPRRYRFEPVATLDGIANALGLSKQRVHTYAQRKV